MKTGKSDSDRRFVSSVAEKQLQARSLAQTTRSRQVADHASSRRVSEAVSSQAHSLTSRSVPPAGPSQNDPTEWGSGSGSGFAEPDEFRRDERLTQAQHARTLRSRLAHFQSKAEPAADDVRLFEDLMAGAFTSRDEADLRTSSDGMTFTPPMSFLTGLQPEWTDESDRHRQSSTGQFSGSSGSSGSSGTSEPSMSEVIPCVAESAEGSGAAQSGSGALESSLDALTNGFEMTVETRQLGSVHLKAIPAPGGGWRVSLRIMDLQKLQWLRARLGNVERGLTRELGAPVILDID